MTTSVSKYFVIMLLAISPIWCSALASEPVSASKCVAIFLYLAGNSNEESKQNLSKQPPDLNKARQAADDAARYLALQKVAHEKSVAEIGEEKTKSQGKEYFLMYQSMAKSESNYENIFRDLFACKKSFDLGK